MAAASSSSGLAPGVPSKRLEKLKAASFSMVAEPFFQVPVHVECPIASMVVDEPYGRLGLVLFDGEASSREGVHGQFTCKYHTLSFIAEQG